MTDYPKPATPLPWNSKLGWDINSESSPVADARLDGDAAYILTACNAFPHLVAALTYVDAHWPSNVVREALAIARGEAQT